MKRIISMLIAVIMVTSMISFSAFVSNATDEVTAANAEHTLDEVAHNVAINVPYFSGSIKYVPLSGNPGGAGINPGRAEDVVKNLNSDKLIRLDGVVTEDEWGKPIANIDRDYAATLGGTEVSAENTYYWHLTEKELEDLKKAGVSFPFSLDWGFSYKVWMAWDEEYFLLAVEVKDPDANSCAKDHRTDNIWDNDAIQFRIDPDGPNSVVNGHGYDASVNAVPFASVQAARTVKDGDGIGGNEVGNRISKFDGKVCNIGVAYADGTNPRTPSTYKPAIYDMSLRYYPYNNVVTVQDGDNIIPSYTSLDWKSYWIDYGDLTAIGKGKEDKGISKSYPDPRQNPYLSYVDEEDVASYYAYASVKPVIDSVQDGETYHTTTTYEVAIPWRLVNGSYYEIIDDEKHEITFVDNSQDAKAGDEYGFSMVAMTQGPNAKGIPTKYKSHINSWLTWGSGICGSQMEGTDYKTAGGSNSLVLVSDELKTIGCDHTFKAPDCTHPYVCTKPGCGYKKGFKTGHSYKSVVITPLSKNQDGLIRTTCTVCNDTFDTVVEADGGSAVLYAYDGTPTYDSFGHIDQLAENAAKIPANKEFSIGDKTSSWQHQYRPLTKYDSNGNVMTYEDGTEKWIEDTTASPLTDPDGRIKATYRLEGDEMIFDLKDTYAGTYFQTDHNYKTFSYKYDFRLTGDDFANFGSREDELYHAGFFHKFGGMQPTAGGGTAYGLNYACGFFPNEPGSTVGKFKVTSTTMSGIPKSSEPTVFAESAEYDLGTDWHEMTFVFDEAEGAVFYYMDGECVVGAASDLFKMNNNDQTAILNRFDVSCELKGMATGQKLAFLSDSAPVVTGHTVTCDGTVIGTYNEGETVELPVPEGSANGTYFYRFYTWEGADVVRSRFSADNTTSNGRTYTLVMPAEDVVLTPKFIHVADIDGDMSITSHDLAEMKMVLVNGVYYSDDVLEANDINGDGSLTSGDVQAFKEYMVGKFTITK